MQEVLQSCGTLTEDMKAVLKRSSYNIINEADAHLNNLSFLVQRARNTGQVSADLLTFGNQATSQEQNERISDMTMLTMKDSLNVRVITLVTLCFLPFSFVAVSILLARSIVEKCLMRDQTILGMELFDFDATTQNFIISNRFWIFFVIGIPLTATTLVFWRWRVRVHGKRLSESSVLRRNKQMEV